MAKYLNFQDIADIQSMIGELSGLGEKSLNDAIIGFRQSIHGGTYVKATAVANVNFWETKFRAHKNTLTSLVSKLPS